METPLVGPDYRAKYDQMMEKAIPQELAKQREERRQLELLKLD